MVEEEWIVTLSTVDPDDIIYLDLVEEGQRLAQELKQKVSFYVSTTVRWCQLLGAAVS